jgi:hypothetical protein
MGENNAESLSFHCCCWLLKQNLISYRSEIWHLADKQTQVSIILACTKKCITFNCSLDFLLHQEERRHGLMNRPAAETAGYRKTKTRPHSYLEQF